MTEPYYKVREKHMHEEIVYYDGDGVEVGRNIGDSMLWDSDEPEPMTEDEAEDYGAVAEGMN